MKCTHSCSLRLDKESLQCTIHFIPNFFLPKDVFPNDAKSSMHNWTSELCYWSWDRVSIGPKGNSSPVTLGWVEREEVRQVLEWFGGR